MDSSRWPRKAAKRASDARSSPRAIGLIRAALIGYGAAALSVLFARSGLEAPVPLGLVAAGMGLQLILVFARAWARGETDTSERHNVIATLELLGDGITVLLFALATLGAVTGAAAGL